jgi:hypothetical protein
MTHTHTQKLEGDIPTETERVQRAYLHLQNKYQPVPTVNKELNWVNKYSARKRSSSCEWECLTSLRVAQAVSEHLQRISREMVLIVQDMIMCRPACSLKKYHFHNYI